MPASSIRAAQRAVPPQLAPDPTIARMLADRTVRPEPTFPDAPSDLADACAWAVRHVDWFNTGAGREGWSDERSSTEFAMSEAVWTRALNEPARDLRTLAAKARMLQQEMLNAHPDLDETGDGHQRLMLAILRDAVALGDAVPHAGQVADEAIAVLAALREAWAAYAAVDHLEDNAGYERAAAKREAAIDAAERLPTTSFEAIQAKAFALAWIEHVAVWQRGRARAAYATNGRLAVDIAAFMAAPAEELSAGTAMAPASPAQRLLRMAAHHPGFVPCPAHAPRYLAAIEDAIPAEAQRLLDLAHAEIARRRLGYEGHDDPTLWPRVAYELRRELRVDALGAAAAPLDARPRPTGDDDALFAAIGAHRQADRAFRATTNPADAEWVRQHGGDTSEPAMAPAIAANTTAGERADAAWRALIGTRPRTPEGLRALLGHLGDHHADYGDVVPAPDVFAALADAVDALRRAVGGEVP